MILILPFLIARTAPTLIKLALSPLKKALALPVSSATTALMNVVCPSLLLDYSALTTLTKTLYPFLASVKESIFTKIGFVSLLISVEIKY